MKKTPTRLATARSGAGNRFGAAPAPQVPFREVWPDDLEQLKERLLRQWLARATDADANVRIRRAANDAAALAWLTPYPALVFPGLFEEKLQTALQARAFQARVHGRSLERALAA
jgi:hypothetical protein